jgi:hypothetical protein
MYQHCLTTIKAASKDLQPRGLIAMINWLAMLMGWHL